MAGAERKRLAAAGGCQRVILAVSPEHESSGAARFYTVSAGQFLPGYNEGMHVRPVSLRVELWDPRNSPAF